MLIRSLAEALLHVFPDLEQRDGTSLNFCADMRRLGEETLLHSAVGDDERGVWCGTGSIARFDQRRVTISKHWPTGIVTVNILWGQRSRFPVFVIQQLAALDAVTIWLESLAQ